MLSYLLIAAGWIFWCVFHSLLIWPDVSHAIQQRLGKYRFHYRLFYCVFSLISLSPLVTANFIFKGDLIFSWHGWWQVVRFLFLCCAFVLFMGGAKRYDLQSVLGLRQIHEQSDKLLLHTTKGNTEKIFSTSGVFGCTRHPWYLGGLILLWTWLPQYHISSILTAVILSFYFFIGSYIEESKILKEYSGEYREYQREVSMLIPVKWTAKLFTRIVKGKGDGFS